jgi:hypothetical protein
MIIYAYVMGESVAALFLAGIVPGILVGGGLMLMVRFMADRYDLPKAERIVQKGATISPVEHWVSFVLLRLNIAGLMLADRQRRFRAPRAWACRSSRLSVVIAHLLLMAWRKRVSRFPHRLQEGRGAAADADHHPRRHPVGVFTPTEAAAIAVAYALHRQLLRAALDERCRPGRRLRRSAMASATVLLLVGAAVASRRWSRCPMRPKRWPRIILSLSENPLILLFLINVLLFIVGMFLDAGPAIIILGPILGPIFVDLGVHPVHFAIIMSVNLTVGLATPPMGLVLFVASSVSGERSKRSPRRSCRSSPSRSGDLPDHLFPGDFHDDPAPDRVRQLILNQTPKGRTTCSKHLRNRLMVAAMLAGRRWPPAAQEFTSARPPTPTRTTRTMTVSSSSRTTSKQASNGAIGSSSSSARSSAPTAPSACRASPTAPSTSTSPPPAAPRASFPYVQVLDLPYLMADDRVAEAVLPTAPFVRTMQDMALEDSGGAIRLMTIGNTGGWRNFANTQRRVTAARRHGRAEDPHRRRRPAAGTGAALGASPRRSRGPSSSPRCRPAWSKAPRTASPTSWA